MLANWEKYQAEDKLAQIREQNRIRQEKSKQVLAISIEERKKAQLESKRLQAKYREFCEINNVPRYDWRTRVTEVERNFNPKLNGGYVSEELYIVENSDIIKMELLCVKKDVYIEPMPTRRFNKIKACKKLIANQKVYGITDEEHKINQERLAKQLKELEENYD